MGNLVIATFLTNNVFSSYTFVPETLFTVYTIEHFVRCQVKSHAVEYMELILGANMTFSATSEIELTALRKIPLGSSGLGFPLSTL